MRCRWIRLVGKGVLKKEHLCKALPDRPVLIDRCLLKDQEHGGIPVTVFQEGEDLVGHVGEDSLRLIGLVRTDTGVLCLLQELPGQDLRLPAEGLIPPQVPLGIPFIVRVEGKDGVEVEEETRLVKGHAGKEGEGNGYPSLVRIKGKLLCRIVHMVGQSSVSRKEQQKV